MIRAARQRGRGFQSPDSFARDLRAHHHLGFATQPPGLHAPHMGSLGTAIRETSVISRVLTVGPFEALRERRRGTAADIELERARVATDA